MRLTPKTDHELAALGLLPKGHYSFEVVNAEDTQSKSGNDMIKLTLTVWSAEGRPVTIFDYLLEAMPKKLKHFARHMGMITKYESGVLLAEDCIGKCGTLELSIQEDKTGQYAPRNSVVDYLEAKDAFINKNDNAIKEDDLFNDAIPF